MLRATAAVVEAAPSRGESENESVPLGKGVEDVSDGMIVVVRNVWGVGHRDGVEEWRREGDTKELLRNLSLFWVSSQHGSFRVRDQREISARSTRH